jgi:hypothetical protein
MTVSEGMRADYLRGDPGSARVVAYAMPESAAGEPVVRHVRSQEDPASFSMSWALGTEISGKAPGNQRQQRQLDPHPGLRSAHSQNLRLPVYVIETQPQDFGGPMP